MTPLQVVPQKKNFNELDQKGNLLLESATLDGERFVAFLQYSILSFVKRGWASFPLPTRTRRGRKASLLPWGGDRVRCLVIFLKPARRRGKKEERVMLFVLTPV